VQQSGYNAAFARRDRDMSAISPAKPSIREELSATLKMALPLIAAQLLQVGLGFIDTLMAGRLGALDLAAVALGSTLWVFVFLASLGVMQALSPTVAQFIGAGREARIAHAFQQAIWIALPLGLLSLLATRGIGAVMPVFGVREEMALLAQGYLDAVSWGMPGMCLYLAARYLHEGSGHTRPILIVQLLLLPLNVFGNWLFMYGNWGMPALGGVGAGVSTAFGLWLAGGMMLFGCWRSRKLRRFRVFHDWSAPDWPAISQHLRLGLPIAVSISLESSLFSMVAMLMGQFDAVAVAAHQITINYASLTFMLPLGFSLATTVRVGYAAGAGDYALARLRGWLGVGLGAGSMLISALLMLSLPRLIAGIYTSDTQVIDVAVSLLFAAALFQLSDGLQVSASGALRGLKDTKIPMYVNLLAYWVIGLPAAWLLGIHWGYGPVGLWSGLIVGLSIAAVLLNWRFHRLIEQRAAQPQFAEPLTDGG
jgi:MATE family multidrug resistance protein